MQRHGYVRVVTWALILALLLVSLPAQPVLAATPASDRDLAIRGAPIVLPPGCPPTSETTVANSTPVDLPDTRTPVTTTITVSGADPYLTDVSLQTFIRHTWPADLDITLQSPAGTVVTITTDNGVGNDNVFDGTLWDDSAADSVVDHLYINNTLASPLAPETPLAAFIGEDPNGDWVLTIVDDQAGDSGSLSSWALVLTTIPILPTRSTTTVTNSTPVDLPDTRTPVTTTITVSGLDPNLWDVNLQTFIRHTFPGDLDITLQSPAGTVVTITTDNGVGNDNVFDGTLWDDSAADSVTNHLYTNNTLASPLAPETPLADFIGEDPNGDWVLTITDDSAADSGSLSSWALIFATAGSCPSALTVTGTNPASNVNRTSLSSILVNFSEAAVSDGSSRAANNTANYLLVEDGANGAFDTVDCAAGPAGDDIKKALDSVTYDNSAFVATLRIAAPLAKGSYRLYICGTTSIWSATGIELNYGVNDTLLDFTIVEAAAAADAAQLPPTGFAPGRITALPFQPEEKAYRQSGLTLEIPALGITTEIVGVPQSDGSWDVSWLGNHVGWLEGSAFPTWEGNSVITGHVWNADNSAGIFASLKDLQYGDQILIHAYGQTYTYAVRESNRVQAASTRTALKHEKLAWLTLITCEDYQVLWNTYSARRVVRAVLVNVE